MSPYRKCRLNRKGMTNASVDIMYIDLQRRWDHMNPERTSGKYHKHALHTSSLISLKPNPISGIHFKNISIDF